MALLQIPSASRDMSPFSDMAPSFRAFLQRTPSPHSQKSLPPSPAFPPSSRTSSVYSRDAEGWPLDSRAEGSHHREITASLGFGDSDDDGSGEDGHATPWIMTAAPPVDDISENPYFWSNSEAPTSRGTSSDTSPLSGGMTFGSQQPDDLRGRTTERTRSYRSSSHETLNIHYGRPIASAQTNTIPTAPIRDACDDDWSQSYNIAYGSLSTEQESAAGRATPGTALSDIKLVPRPLFHNPRQLSFERTRDYERSRRQPYIGAPKASQSPSLLKDTHAGKKDISWPLENRLNMAVFRAIPQGGANKHNPEVEDPMTSLLGKLVGSPRAGHKAGHIRVKHDSSSSEPWRGLNLHAAKAAFSKAMGHDTRSKAEKRREELKKSIRVIRNLD